MTEALTSSERVARQAVLRVLAKGPHTLFGVCVSLWHEPGYWSEWPTVDTVLKALRDDGLVVKAKNAQYWSLPADVSSGSA
jgi:hypothetical protein